MYRPDQTGIDDPDVLRAAMHEISFGALVTPHAAGIEITHVPWLVREEGAKTYLESHIARPNPHWKLAGQGQSVVMFQGPHAYISPSFYPSKKIHGKASRHGAILLPTPMARSRRSRMAIGWAHIWRPCRHAMRRGAPTRGPCPMRPWPISQHSNAALSGLRFEVARMEGKWKINQSKSEQDATALMQV